MQRGLLLHAHLRPKSQHSVGKPGRSFERCLGCKRGICSVLAPFAGQAIGFSCRESGPKLSAANAKQPCAGCRTARLQFQAVCLGLSGEGIRGCHNGFWEHSWGSDGLT